uniref:Uncharacterized protein n=1 Tax=Arundo donax TaxID=35708 RepID=A0A0A9DUH1_ARUDO
MSRSQQLYYSEFLLPSNHETRKKDISTCRCYVDDKTRPSGLAGF